MTGRERRPALILLADDDDDDVLLTRRAFESARLADPLVRVRDGEELLAYLRGEPPFDDRAAHPSPSLVLLDLNMPRKDGREALHEIKADPSLRAIPVVVLTTSRAEEDVVRSYRLGVNAFMQKPVLFEKLVEAASVFGRYWLEVVELPPAGPAGEKSP